LFTSELSKNTFHQDFCTLCALT